MPAITNIAITHGDEAAQSIEELLAEPAGRKHEGMQKLLAFLGGLVGGVHRGKVTLGVENGSNSTKASMTITITHANVGTDGVTIGGVEFTEGTDWDAGANATEDATALAAAVNAHASLKGIVTASTAAGVVTLTYYKPGREGNLVTVTTDDATAYDLSAAALGGASSTEEAAYRDWDFL